MSAKFNSLSKEETSATRAKRLRWFIATCFNDNISDLARALGVKPQGIHHYLNGSRRPGSSILDKFYELGMDSYWFMYGAFEPFAENEAGIELKRRFGHLLPSMSEDLKAMKPVLPAPEDTFPALKKLLTQPIKGAFKITEPEEHQLIDAFYNPEGVEAFEIVVGYLMKKREEQYRAMSQVKGNDQ